MLRRERDSAKGCWFPFADRRRFSAADRLGRSALSDGLVYNGSGRDEHLQRQHAASVKFTTHGSGASHMAVAATRD